MAKNDPALFLQLHKPPVLIDEVQYAPELFTYIKIYVDEHHHPGDFWMTGSQIFRLMRGVQESLAGRVALLHMSPLSQREIVGAPCVPFTTDLDRLLAQRDQMQPVSTPELFARLWRGSMPGLVSGQTPDRNVFYSSYLSTYVERDVRNLSGSVDALKFSRFFTAVAARTSQLLNYNTLAEDAELLMDEYLKAHYTPDASVQALVDAAWERLAGDAGEMYLESPYFLNAYRASESADGRSVRTDETNLGDLVTDFMRSYTDADVAIAPGVMIRCSIDQGKIYTLNLYDVFAIGCDLYVAEMTGEELLSRMASSLTDLPFESPAFSQISGASYGYLKEYALSEEGEKIYTIINPVVNGEPLELDKTYRVAYCFVLNESGDLEPVISTMEEAAAAMGEYLKSGEDVILPDVPVPDHRIVPMEEIPAGAVIYEVTLETENEEAA